jgi:hypothetical protein
VLQPSPIKELRNDEFMEVVASPASVNQIEKRKKKKTYE